MVILKEELSKQGSRGSKVIMFIRETEAQRRDVNIIPLIADLDWQRQGTKTRFLTGMERDDKQGRIEGWREALTAEWNH